MRSRPYVFTLLYNLKLDGRNGTLCLSCRLVPHRSPDLEKDDIRTDSSTAQFQITRTTLLLVVILGFEIATVDMKRAYPQFCDLSNNIYARPPKGRTPLPKIAWKLLKTVCSIVESACLQQLSAKSWIHFRQIYKAHG